MTSIDRLKIRNFAQISEADLAFGDLTVLVGAQATGKSLALQWLKLALDGRHVVEALQEAGHVTKDPEVLIDLVFGSGMSSAWRSDSEVTFNRKQLHPTRLRKLGSDEEAVFFIPAHRSLLISDGWAAPFQRLTPEVPAVARMFSQNLFDRFSDQDAGPLFPKERLLKKEYRDEIDRAIFHQGHIAIEEDQQHARRLRLIHGDAHLPFMTWTAGQREFTPLLLGLYHLLPPRKLTKRPAIDWVVIEEPEMGLHPQAITVVMLLVLDLLWRGYRVVLSTHSPHLLTIVWALRRLIQFGASWELVCDAFDVPTSQQLEKVAKAALEKDYRVHLLAFGQSDTVTSTDISDLDPEAGDDREAGWGGLTELSSRFGAAVRQAVNAST